MEEQLVIYETAKLAKEKGFDWKVKHTFKYWKHENVEVKKTEPMCMINYFKTYGSENELLKGSNFNILNGNCPNISAPTQSLLQKWLREVHDLWVEIVIDFNHSYIDYAVKGKNIKGKYNTRKRSNYGDNSQTKTYEEALEKGLQEALKLI